MIKILYLSPYFWPEEIGSAPYCTELALWLREHGYAVDAVTFRPHYPSPEPFGPWEEGGRDRETYNDITIKRVPVRSRGKGSFLDRVRNDLTYLRRVLRLALSGRCGRPDVVIVYVPSILGIYGACVVRLFTSARIIAVVHDIESGLARSVGLASNLLLMAVMRLIERIGFNRAEQLVVLTKGMKQEIERIGCRRPIHVLPIWSTLPPPRLVPREGPVRVMYSGNFGKKQGLPQLIPLFQRLRTQRDMIEIIMRGDGSEKESFREQAQAAGVFNIRYLPLAPADQFMSTLQSVHIHLVPQALDVANYALPSKLISIMSAGRPFACIAEKDSPLDLLARDSGAGICVQPGEDELLYEKILEIAVDHDLQEQMGKNGRRFVDKNMNKVTIMQAYEALIRALISTQPVAKLGSNARRRASLW